MSTMVFYKDQSVDKNYIYSFSTLLCGRSSESSSKLLLPPVLNSLPKINISGQNTQTQISNFVGKIPKLQSTSSGRNCSFAIKIAKAVQTGTAHLGRGE